MNALEQEHNFTDYGIPLQVFYRSIVRGGDRTFPAAESQPTTTIACDVAAPQTRTTSTNTTSNNTARHGTAHLLRSDVVGSDKQRREPLPPVLHLTCRRSNLQSRRS